MTDAHIPKIDKSHVQYVHDINKAKYAPKTTDSLKPLDVVELLKNQGNISFEAVSEETGIPVKRVERIYRNDLPKEDEMRRILEWVGGNR